MIVLTDIFRDITEEISTELGTHINFMFGDWAYISNVLQIMSKSREKSEMKYPIICLFSPFNEDKTDARYYCKAKVDLLIACQTRSEYTNEERQQNTFAPILRPVYNALIGRILKSPYFDFDGNLVPHIYTENYRYGSRGVMASNGKRFNDLIDGIDIKELFLKLKKESCYGNRL